MTDLAAPPCRWHYGFCAFRDDDPTRCPTCHVPWPVILSSGWHSCETPTRGDRTGKAKARLARLWRLAAAEHAASLALTPTYGTDRPAPVLVATPHPEQPQSDTIE